MLLSPQVAAPHRPDRQETLAVSPAHRPPVRPRGLPPGGYRERDPKVRAKGRCPHNNERASPSRVRELFWLLESLSRDERIKGSSMRSEKRAGAYGRQAPFPSIGVMPGRTGDQPSAHQARSFRIIHAAIRPHKARAVPGQSRLRNLLFWQRYAHLRACLLSGVTVRCS
jgi:hypothetical protein